MFINENVFSTRAIEKENESERERELFRASVRLIRAKRDASASFYFFDRRKRSDLRSLLLIICLMFWTFFGNDSFQTSLCLHKSARRLKNVF